MKRNLSKISMITNFTLLIANSALLFIVAILLLALTGNFALLLLPGMFFLALISAVWGIFDVGYTKLFSAIAGVSGTNGQSMFTREEIVTFLDPSTMFRQMGDIVSGAFSKEYVALNPSIPVALLMSAICLVLGIVCACHLRKMYAVVSTPMDWYSAKLSGVFVNFVLTAVYSLCMLVGALGIVSGEHAMDGAAQKLAVYFIATATVVFVCSMAMVWERLSTVKKYKKMDVEQQEKLCDRQAKYMNKRVRRKQLRKLKSKGRTAKK